MPESRLRRLFEPFPEDHKITPDLARSIFTRDLPVRVIRGSGGNIGTCQ